MCNIQLLREKVDERLSAAAETFLQRLDQREASAEIPALRALLSEQLTAAAEEIAALFAETVAELEERSPRAEEETRRRRKVLDSPLKPRGKLQPAGQLPMFCSRNRKEHTSALLQNKSPNLSV